MNSYPTKPNLRTPQANASANPAKTTLPATPKRLLCIEKELPREFEAITLEQDPTVIGKNFAFKINPSVSAELRTVEYMGEMNAEKFRAYLDFYKANADSMKRNRSEIQLARIAKLDPEELAYFRRDYDSANRRVPYWKRDPNGFKKQIDDIIERRQSSYLASITTPTPKFTVILARSSSKVKLVAASDPMTGDMVEMEALMHRYGIGKKPAQEPVAPTESTPLATAPSTPETPSI